MILSTGLTEEEMGQVLALLPEELRQELDRVASILEAAAQRLLEEVR